MQNARGPSDKIDSGSGARKGCGVPTNITREELKVKMDRGEKFVLVDALSAKHYESSELSGAANREGRQMYPNTSGKTITTIAAHTA